jgi:hypothetical protein
MIPAVDYPISFPSPRVLSEQKSASAFCAISCDYSKTGKDNKPSEIKTISVGSGLHLFSMLFE